MWKIRIALVKIGELVPGETSRPRRMTLLARALVAAGHTVTWWTSDWNHQFKRPRPVDELREKASEEGIEVTFLNAPGYSHNVSPWRFVHHEVFARTLISRLRDEAPPDLIWACFPTVSTARHLSKWVKMNNTRLIFDIRDLSPDVFLAMAPPAFRPIVELAVRPVQKAVGRAFSAADGLVAVSEGYLGWAEGLVLGGSAPSRSAVFPLGFPRPASWSRRVTRTDSDGFLRVVFAGTLGRSFDSTTLVAAAERAAQQRLPVRFEIAGEGEGGRALAQAAERLDNLAYLGWLDAADLERVLGAADVGLMGYVAGATQGLPNKVFEYMANGLAILNSLTGEASEFVTEHGIGLNYSAGDPNDLCERLSTLTRDSANTMGDKAARLFEGSYDAVAISKRMVSFIESVAGGQSGASP
jgi:glycosyltransferase involved in cell wall biosynthesis